MNCGEPRSGVTANIESDMSDSLYAGLLILVFIGARVTETIEMAATQEILDRYRCPKCGRELMAPAGKTKTRSDGKILLFGVLTWGIGLGALKTARRPANASIQTAERSVARLEFLVRRNHGD